MTALAHDLIDIACLAAEEGLQMRGAFLCRPADGVPPQADGGDSRCLVLLGNIGRSIWPTFAASPEAADGLPDPMNRWSARVIGALADQLGGLALFPFGGPPYHPFLRWAQRAEALSPSPLGMLIHPVFGLWHAYRGAIALGQDLKPKPVPVVDSPCETCADKPCLSACPVDAFAASGYDVPACTAHLEAAAGAVCMTGGCLARRACPVGRNQHYDADQAAFHMRAFVLAQSTKSDL